jgi:hypothetical protein
MSVFGYAADTQPRTIGGPSDAGAIVFTEMAELPGLLAAVT